MSTYYDLLGVAPTASPDQIKQAYRQKIKLYHPDTRASSPEADLSHAQTMTQALNLAYAVLSDEGKRAVYDARHRAPTYAPAPPQTPYKGEYPRQQGIVIPTPPPQPRPPTAHDLSPQMSRSVQWLVVGIVVLFFAMSLLTFFALAQQNQRLERITPPPMITLEP